MRTEAENHGGEPQELSPIKLRVQAARRARAAIGLSTIILLTIVLGTTYRLWFLDRQFGIQAILLVGVIGVVLLNLGRTHRSRRMTELAILRFHTSYRFYGTVLSVSAALAFCYALTLKPKVEARQPVAAAPAPKPEQKPVVPLVKTRAELERFPAPKPEQKPVVPVAVSLPEPPKPAEFPALNLSGVILNGSHSSALINGQTVAQGDMIEGVRLVAVYENKVIVEKDGCRKTISRFTLSGTKPAKAGK
jgi:hypothetical protein